MKTTKNTKLYMVISTTNEKIEGWKRFFIGSKQECQKYQLEGKEFNDIDIYSQTLNKNSKIIRILK